MNKKLLTILIPSVIIIGLASYIIVEKIQTKQQIDNLTGQIQQLQVSQANSNTQSQTQSNQNAKTENTGKTDANKGKKTDKSYTNVRFGFGISYPENWDEPKESDNGDGAIIYNKNNNDIRVYAGFDVDGFEKKYIDSQAKVGKSVTDFTTNSGLSGKLITGEEQGKKLISFTAFKNDIHYNFYALVTDDFKKNNEKVIIDVIKNFHITQGNAYSTN